ncbi:hypothetical protein FRB98_003470 [Tulasnella sp. 332]|nr:hypothetical protein FRB98_003470 [Tulasnella sp. 332]
MPPKSTVTQEDKARIMSSQKTGGKDMSSGSFSARIQRAADTNTNTAGGGTNASTGTSGQTGKGGK